MTYRIISAAVLCAMLGPQPLIAQDTSDTAQAEASADQEAQTLLTQDELQELVGPVALYPDTLLIQVLVAATYPLEVVKADRFVQDNKEAEDLETQIEAQGWDESVTVLATAFPDVLADMAVHVEWTETIGTAMLAQDDDVMAAVQDMRKIAEDAGTLTSGDEQTVEVTQDAGEETIIIQPTDPEVVYVPQYEPETVYVDDGSDVGDAVVAGLITFGTVALISEIFDDDDHWNDYWGCRNCGGWNGNPIIRNPDIDIDIDGDVNIGDRDNIGWDPGDERRDKARDEIGKRRGDGATTMPVKKPDRGDEMRQRLSKETGAADISRPGADRDIQRPEQRAPDARRDAVDRTRAKVPEGTKQKAKAKAQSRPKQAARPAAPRAQGGGNRGAAMQRRASSGQRAQAGAARGHASRGGGRARR
ncbi:DUF3300 domain-containing protein [Falsiruegeria mediterranea]|jgi:Protein of unknown function (DUF3300)|uniref:DUF3300 domain-containing protein n=1 Tax=Falsiruegeria mediterranea M17 TaxID=1200281 RepID=A0A2R8C479_9RHOB|nr:DUF3300 domain-containing protein [Falsiruegeria mediterranea]SPJ27212.1 hypothetical protein TRM7615_00695 [Falsiruegeria mediterranea M17]